MTTCYDHEWHAFENGECDDCQKKACKYICRLCGMQACRPCRAKMTLAYRRSDEEYVKKHYKKLTYLDPLERNVIETERSCH
jgi:hypothetical protein